jgi:hypothetical protein
VPCRSLQAEQSHPPGRRDRSAFFTFLGDGTPWSATWQRSSSQAGFLDVGLALQTGLFVLSSLVELQKAVATASSLKRSAIGCGSTANWIFTAGFAATFMGASGASKRLVDRLLKDAAGIACMISGARNLSVAAASCIDDRDARMNPRGVHGRR